MHGRSDFLFGASAHGITSFSGSDTLSAGQLLQQKEITVAFYQKPIILSRRKVPVFTFSTKVPDLTDRNWIQ
jgi:hypothetical protein